MKSADEPSRFGGILGRLRPGLRGKLALFSGLLIFLLSGALLAVALKQQEKTIRELSLQGVIARLAPVRKTTQEMQHTVRNLVRLEEFRAAVERHRQRGARDDRSPPDNRFTFEYLQEMRSRLREQLKIRSGGELGEREFQILEKNAAIIHRALQQIDDSASPALVKKTYLQLRGPGRALDRELRSIYRHRAVLRQAFLGLDLSRYRVESINLYYATHFDSANLEPHRDLARRIRELRGDLASVDRQTNPEQYEAILYNLRGLDERRKQQLSTEFFRINSRQLWEQKELLQGLYRLRRSFYEQRPLLDPQISQYHDRRTDSNYIASTIIFFITPEVTERARLIRKTLHSPEGIFWRRYLEREKTLNQELAALVEKMKTSAEFRGTKNTDDEDGKPEGEKKRVGTTDDLRKRYARLLKKRGGLFEETRRLFQVSGESERLELEGRLTAEKKRLQEVQGQVGVVRAELRNVKKREDRNRLKKKLRNLHRELGNRITRIQDLKSRIDYYFGPRDRIIDAFENLRSALLEDSLFMNLEFDAEGYNSYVESPRNRQAVRERWAQIRNWILFGCGKSGECRGEGGISPRLRKSIGSSAMLIRSRDQAERRMWDLDCRDLVWLSDRSLFENTAGYTRILFDRSRLTRTIARKQRHLTDTALSIGLRIVFLALLLSGLVVRTIRSIIAGADRVRHGDFSVRFDYRGSDEIGNLVRSLNLMTAGLREREELRGEMSAAEEIQKLLLPRQTPASMERFLSIGHFYKAMSGVGGDYYDFIDCGGGSMMFCIADVSSHGVGPAIVMSLLRSQLHSIAQRGVHDPATVLLELNARLFRETPSGMFITMFLGVYEGNSGNIQYCSAGHNRGLVHRRTGGIVEELSAGGLPLGWMDNDDFRELLAVHRIRLEPGDLFFQFTDGVNEALRPNFEQFGTIRLKTVIERTAHLQPQTIVRSVALTVEKFTGKKIICEGPSELNDDIAMIALRRRI